MAAEKRSVRQIVQAVRAFGARSAPAPPAASVWLPCGSPEWRAWAAYRGKAPPIDSRRLALPQQMAAGAPGWRMIFNQRSSCDDE